jgi:hypothetical protein
MPFALARYEYPPGVFRQFAAAHAAGVTMLYQAMFDELDEGTAIFKCTNNPPTGESQFVAESDLPSDHYLWLCGLAGKLLRNEVSPSNTIPPRSQTATNAK